jgi:hypothetical protein
LSTPRRVYVAKGVYIEYAKDEASVEEHHNESPAKEGDNKPLAKMATGLGKTIGLSPQRALGTRTPCKATTSPLPQRVTGPQPSTIVKVPKRPS